ncbi:MAG: hypothetical protein AB8B50_21465, partial [Pirellulaceae bacterium]
TNVSPTACKLARRESDQTFHGLFEFRVVDQNRQSTFRIDRTLIASGSTLASSFFAAPIPRVLSLSHKRCRRVSDSTGALYQRCAIPRQFRDA